MAAEQERGAIRTRKKGLAKLGICLVLLVFLALSCIPPSSATAAAQISIDPPGAAWTVRPWNHPFDGNVQRRI